MIRGEEKIVQIPISCLKPFPNHPFLVREDRQMHQLIESIRQAGVLVPVVVYRYACHSVPLPENVAECNGTAYHNRRVLSDYYAAGSNQRSA